MEQEQDSEKQQLASPEVEKLTDWENEPKLADLVQNLQDARPFQTTHITRVNRWLDHLNVTGSAKYKAPAGRSSVQPKLIRKHAEWRYGDLSEPFLSSERIFRISPRTAEDRKAAQQNEILLNWQFDTLLNKVNLIDQYVRTVVDEGTVVLETSWVRDDLEEEVDVPVYAFFEMRDPQAIEVMQQTLQQVNNDPQFLPQLPPEVQEAVKYSMEKGGLFTARQTGTTKAKQVKVLKNHPMVSVAELQNLVVDPTCGYDFDKAMFMAYSVEMSVGELRKDKRYKNMEKVDSGRSPLSEPDHVRPTPEKNSEFNFSDDGRKKVVVQMYWGLFDIDGNGILTPIVAAWIGNTLIRMEKNPFPDGKPPFVIVPLLPIRKSIYGEPDAEMLIDNQKIIGAVTRGMIDLMARSANAQRGTAKNFLDVTNQRRFDAGQDYQFNPNVHPSNGLFDHKFPDIPASAPNMVQMANYEAESLTGVKVYGDSGLSGASLGPTAAGAKGVMTAASRRTTGILRRLAMGMTQVANKIVAMNQEFLSEEEVVRVTNEEFVPVRREDLKGNFDLKVEISTAEENEAKASRLEFMLQTMGNTNDPGLIKMMLADAARLRNMPDLAKRLETYEPTPDPLAQKQKELEIAKLEAEIARLRGQAARDQAQALLDEARARDIQSSADQKDLDYVEQDTGTKHARDIEKIGAQARANTEHSITKAILERSNGRGPDGKVDNTPTDRDIVEAINYNAAN